MYPPVGHRSAALSTQLQLLGARPVGEPSFGDDHTPNLRECIILEEMNRDLDMLWTELSPDERWCLLGYRVKGTKSGGARLVGMTPKWMDNRQRKNPAFREAMDSREFTVPEIEERLTLDLAGTAMVALRNVLWSFDAKPNHKIAAANLARRLARDFGKHGDGGEHPLTYPEFISTMVNIMPRPADFSQD